MDAIDEAKANGDSIGGIVEVIVEGVPVGVGSYVHYDRKLDSKLAAAVLSINAFKGVEFGIGFEAARKTAVKSMTKSSGTKKKAIRGQQTVSAVLKAE